MSFGFGYFLLEEGVEMELKVSMREIVSILDEEVPSFTYDSYIYRISAAKGVLGSQLKLLVKPWNSANAAEVAPAVGFIEVNKTENGKISFKIPPRDQWGDDETRAFDEEGKFFSSFIFQLLNAFQSRGLIDLPGQLPVR